MDSAPYSVNESSSVKRCYRFFRTMGLRHLVVVNAFHKVTGIITRNDVTHHRMQSHWMKEVRIKRCCTVLFSPARGSFFTAHRSSRYQCVFYDLSQHHLLLLLPIVILHIVSSYLIFLERSYVEVRKYRHDYGAG